MLVTAPMLEIVRAAVQAGSEPWASAFAFSQSSSTRNVSSLDYLPTPHEDVVCGSYSNPDIGCSDEKRDCEAAYTHALMWAVSQDERHAEKAIEIMDAYSSTIQKHSDSNAPLQSAWVASVFPRAAEIIKHTYGKWAGASAFKHMLLSVYLPMVADGSTANGNWELSMIEAAMHIAVFAEDRSAFDRAVELWRARVPAYLYITADGSRPKGQHGQAFSKSYWHDLDTYRDGVCQETCRDLGHVQYGLAAMVNAAETAWQQGLDLYGAEAERMIAGLEFHAGYISGESVPSWLCGGSLNSVKADPMWEIAYNHFSNRMGVSMPFTEKVLGGLRPTSASHHMEWETLTHYNGTAAARSPASVV